jgi:(S)-citramalyl-CoA lyase
MLQTLRNRRSLLVYSALAVERWDEVMYLGADMVCFDLEDGTAAERKDEARELCLSYIERRQAPSASQQTTPTLSLLRINSPHTLAGLKDIVAVAQMSHPPDGIIIPKTATAHDVRLVSNVLTHSVQSIEIIPLIETQSGVRNCRAIAAASPTVSALFLGSVDLSGELDSDMGWDALYRARSQLVEAASECDLDSIDGPWLSVDDTQGLASELARLAPMGFTGKASYDPSQIAAIHSAFTPSAEAIDKAQRIIDAVAASASGGARVDGQSVNKANAKGAARLIARARRRGVCP